jgi:hypothetical protein
MKRLIPCLLAACLLVLQASRGNNVPTTAMESEVVTVSEKENTLTNSPSVEPMLPASQDDEPEQFTQANNTEAVESKLSITIGTTVLTATLEDNSSVRALLELLAVKPLTINMSDYGSMEKVGDLGTSLPRNDEQISTEPGDLILYQGNSLVIYYAPNSWSFTRLGKIDGITKDELMKILGNGNVTVTLSL